MPTSTTPVAVAIVVALVPEAPAEEAEADSVDPDAILAVPTGAPTSEGPAAGRPAVRVDPVDRGVQADPADPADVLTEAVLGVTTVEVDPVVDPARIGAAIVDRIDVLRLRKPCPRGSLSIWFRIRPGLIR